MKELSVEEKAQLYDEAIKRGKQIQSTPYTAHWDVMKEVVEHILPELQELDDERIRKEMIDFLQETIDNVGESPNIWTMANAKKWLAWLEKQDEQKNDSNVEPKFEVGQTIKKEGFNSGFTITKIKDGFYYNCKGDHFPFTDQDNWELVKQSSAWSEEDEEYADLILRELKQDEEDSPEYSRHFEQLIGWFANRFKSIIFQNTWKPSAEQMEILYEVSVTGYVPGDGQAIISLYQDLKKL